MTGEGRLAPQGGLAGKIVLAAGMPRAGSGWYYNLVHDLVVAAGGEPSREIRQRYHLHGILTEVNCNIGVLSLPRLLRVLVPAIQGRRFTIKVHSGPTRAARFFVQRGWMVPTYIYRDPRDALLSAYEFGRRVQEKRGRPNAFSRLSTIDLAIDFMADYMRHWRGWVGCPGTLVTRYEDLLTDYEGQAGRLARFLGLDAGREKYREVIERYRPGQAGHQGDHFYKGTVGRYRHSLSEEQQARCSQLLGPYLAQMGYPLG